MSTYEYKNVYSSKQISKDKTLNAYLDEEIKIRDQKEKKSLEQSLWPHNYCNYPTCSICSRRKLFDSNKNNYANI